MTSGAVATPEEDDVDPFDALMGIDAAEFSDLLDAAADTAEDRAEAGTLRGGVPVVDIDELTPEAFQARFLDPRRPVVIRDPAGSVVPLHLTPTYLRDAHGDAVVPLDVTDAKRVSVPLRDFIDAVSSSSRHDHDHDDDHDAEPDPSTSGRDEDAPRRTRASLRARYLRNLQMFEWFPDEASKLRLPALFGPNALADETKTPGAPPAWRRWFELFVVHPECVGFPFLHRDTCHVHAASMQIHGRKRFTLFHPDDGPFLYPAGGTGCRSTLPPEALQPGAAPEVLAEYPALAHAKRVTCDVRAGEILVVPADWWHTARAVGDDASVSIAASFVDDAGVDAFVDARAEFEALKSLAAVGAGIIT